MELLIINMDAPVALPSNVPQPKGALFQFREYFFTMILILMSVLFAMKRLEGIVTHKKRGYLEYVCESSLANYLLFRKISSDES